MRPLTPSIIASPGESILLKSTTSGTVFAYYAVLKRFDTSGVGTDVVWTSAVLEGPGGTATVGPVSGYHVIIFPEVGEEGVISLTLDVGSDNRKAKLTTDESAAWRIFVPTPQPPPPSAPSGGEA